ncbi:MAG: RsmD family RNA methyltransferase [Planctomycetes bacterium]|nr:RsmD family RNA methyltransferase [Planctomycetota bacterium]MCB9884256.1 RsmD family RNA methyltransferase [Planctomycetota bacterium]
MSLKIISGEYGGRVLKAVRGLGTRPLLGQVREAIFNILGDRIEGAIVWDLFAGSGASGIESLSRGAARVLFVEKNSRAIDVLKQNLKLLGPDALDRGVVLRGDAWDPPVMHRGAFGTARDDADPEAASDAEVAPDVIFLDPPYAMVAEDPVKSMARARRLLDRTAPNGCVLFHFEAGVLDADDFDGDLDLDLREWGSTAIAMLWRPGEAPEHLRRRWAKERGASA